MFGFQRRQSNSDRICTLERTFKLIMAGINDIQTAQAAEKGDLATLTTLITQLLTAFANGTMTPTQAQALLDEVNAEDATIKSSIGSIQAALPAPPAAQ